MSVDIWATSETYTFTAKTWTATDSGDNAANWTGSGDGNGWTSGQGIQLLTTNTGVDGVTATSPTSFSNVTQVVVTYNSNKTGGEGSMAIKIGSNTETSANPVGYSGSGDGRSANYTSTFNFSPAQSGYVVLRVITTTNSIWVKSVEITCSAASPKEVTFNAERGTCAVSSRTEASGGAGVVLPEATADCSSIGWGFYGWATSAQSTSTTSAPTIVGKAGDRYYPAADITLHAVYAKGEYTKETSSITSDAKYLIVANSTKNYIMTDNYSLDGDEGQMASAQVDETSSGKYHAASINPNWCYTIENGDTDGKYYIRDVKNSSSANYVDIAYENWYGKGKDDTDEWELTVSSGNWTLKNEYYSNYLGFNTSTKVFYRASGTTFFLYKAGTINYWSSPTCKAVTLAVTPAGGGTATFDDNSSTTMSFGDEYTGDITATPTSGWDFIEWTSSDEDAAVVTDDDDPTTDVYATDDATITAHFYQNHTLTYTLTGVTKTSGPTSITKTEKDGFTATFSINAHYKSPVTCSVAKGGTPLTEDTDYTWDGEELLLSYDDIDGDIVVTITATAKTYSDYRFSCAELTLTPKLVTASTPIFITSSASKQVRSQDSILIVGSGLTPSASLTFPSLSGTKFSVKSRVGGDFTTKADGTIDTVAYVFYTPGAGDTSDGLDKLTGFTASVSSGAKPLTVTLTQSIIGRHLPAEFVIAAKRNNKWYALPDTMTVLGGGTPKPIEIAVDDINNPSIAYATADTKYSLEGPSSGNISGGVGQYVKLVMDSLWSDNSDHSKGHAPMFGSATGSAKIGKSGNSQATNPLSKGWWWLLIQKNTSVENPQDAKYQIYCANNDTTLSLKENAGNPKWGLYKNGIDELRLIPVSSAVPTEAYFVEWGKNGGVVEVDAEGVGATKVQAVLNGTESVVKTLSQTKTSGNKNSKYNYTLDFNDEGFVIDFSLAASNGKMLTLLWLDGSENLKAVSNIIVPKIIATTTTMSAIESGDTPWSTWEVHVLPGATLEANAGDFSSQDVTIKHLEIYQNATVKVTKGAKGAAGTLDVTTLVLRNGWSRATEKTYDVARLYITPSTASLTTTNVYADWYIDYDQYYPVAVPWDATVANFTYRYCSVTPSVGYNNNIRLRYYDGAGRAAGTNAGSSNWKDYGKSGNTDVPTKLLPAQGYVMSAKRPTGKAFSIIRMPLTIPSSSWTASGEQGSVKVDATTTYKNRVSVQANSGTGAWYTKGWNFIANPYMALFNGNDAGITGKLHIQDGGDVRYATIPDTDFKGFSQVNITTAKLKPSSGFLVQVETDGTLEFSKANITPSAPARYTNSPEAIAEQEAYILLSGENGDDQMGLVIGSDYTADYEINADLSKMIGEANIVKTWMRYTDIDMAYVAINEQLAREWIPVTVHIPAEGEYTYSLMNSSTVDELEGLYLTDYLTGATTNLLYNDYTFSAEAGTNTERFAINAIVGERKVPTGVDINGVDKNGTEPVKFIWHDKVFILHNNVIYDSTGKRVNVINK